MGDCEDMDKVKPLDTLLEDQVKEFETGKDAVCDKELDKTMWDLGHFDDEEPVMEAKEFAEENPIEEDLIEKKLVFGRDEKLRYMKDETAKEEVLPGDELVDVHSMNPDTCDCEK